MRVKAVYARLVGSVPGRFRLGGLGLSRLDLLV